MEYIKKEDLIEGDIFVAGESYNFINKKGTTFSIDEHKVSKNASFHKTASFTYTNIRSATVEQKHWLETCIKLDKFITFEEAIKTFIPEYVECIIEQPQYNNYGQLGKIYKVSNWNYSENDCYLIGTTSSSTAKRRFKPSTKEAYDAQFVVKEPEFILPEKWCITTTIESQNIIFNWLEKNTNWKGRINGNNLSIGNHYCIEKNICSGWMYYAPDRKKGYEEINFEQFKKYVLKEEIVEEKVIESLPQFKVIETIETITKVENNEGNQFFIGDVVKSDLGAISTIKGFKYNVRNTAILALTNNSPIIGININKLEHYIEPKVEFVLPEKWGILRTNENDKIITDYINKQYNYNHSYLFRNKHNPYLHNRIGWSSNYKLFKDYTEITFDQFKKYVLKEVEKPLIIAESHKDMLDLKAEGIDTIVLSNESLLDKAKRLYPIGTKFKSPTSGVLFTIKDHTCEISRNSKTIVFSTNEANLSGDLYGCVHLRGNVWAEIVEYPHGFKVGDKIRSKYGNNDYYINKIEGNQLFFETNYLPKINSILAKNAIKVN